MPTLVPQAVIDAARSIAETYIKGIEQLRLKAYRNKGDKWTAGWGSTNGVHEGMVVTVEQAQQMLDDAMDSDFRVIIASLKRTPTAHQLAAFQSFAYNIGEAGFAGSTVLRRFNAGDIKGAASAFDMWIKADDGTGKRVDNNGLKRRRREEVQIFLTPDTNPTPTFIPTEDAPQAEPDEPAPMPQTVSSTGVASTAEKIGTAIISGGGVSGGIQLATSAAEKGAITLAVLFGGIVVLTVVGAIVWYVLRGGRKG